MSRKSKQLQGDMVVPLKVPEDMRKRVRALAEGARLSDADIMRLSIERGIAAVEQMFETHNQQKAA